MNQEYVDLDIAPDSTLDRFHDVIAIPAKMREMIGVAVGQRMRFEVGEDVLMLLVVSSGQEGPAGVSGITFEALSRGPLKYTVPPITLGCDPEFFILWRGSVMSAATYLPFHGQVGSDGGLGELRPAYDTHESKVVSNLGDLIRQIPRRVVRQDWAKGFPRSGSELNFEAHSYLEGLAAGFHVHIGLPPELLHTKKEVHEKSLNHLVRALDWYLATLLVPLEPSNSRRCGRSNFGLPGDYRLSNITLEYRTPGGFYLRNPTLAGGLLGISLLIAESFVSRLREISKDFLKLGQISERELQEVIRIPRPELIRYALMDQNKALAMKAIPKVINALRGLPDYPKHQYAVERFVKVVEEGVSPDANLITNWRS